MSKGSRGKLIIVILVFVMLAMSGCAESGDVSAKSTESTPTAEEVAAYWEQANAKDVIRKEAIRRDAVIVEWRGDWSANAQLALFHGRRQAEDVKVGAQYLDLVERDQIILFEYKDGAWAAVVNVPNNLQPGGKIVFVR